MERLVEETGLEDRLEGVSDRLEACDDLCEGANDRTADYHWYLECGWMQLSSMALLVVDVALMGSDIYLRHLH